MREFVKPEVIEANASVLRSADGKCLIIKSEFVEKLKNYVNLHPVCPEVDIGLGVPRDPIRVIEIDGH